jgi:hypothetical protein
VVGVGGVKILLILVRVDLAQEVEVVDVVLLLLGKTVVQA